MLPYGEMRKTNEYLIGAMKLIETKKHKQFI